MQAQYRRKEHESIFVIVNRCAILTWCVVAIAPGSLPTEFFECINQKYFTEAAVYKAPITPKRMYMAKKFRTIDAFPMAI